MPVSVPQAFALALQLHQSGRLADAESLYRQILGAQPNNADSWHMLGVIANQTGRRDLSAEWLRRAITLNPRIPDAHFNLGNVLRVQGHLDAAITSYRQAISLRPDFASAFTNLGLALSERGERESAIDALSRALQFDPSLVPAHYNLGNVFKDQGDLENAEAAYRRALALDPQLAPALNNLAIVLLWQERLSEALAASRRALEIQPDLAQAENNAATILTQQGRLDEAIAAGQRALQIQPDFAEAWNTLGNALRDRGDVREAIAAYRRGAELSPPDAGIHNSLLFSLHHVPDLDAQEIAREQQHWSQRLCASLRQHWISHSNDPEPQRPLRIGYVSPDFRNHVVGRNLLPFFRCHNRQDFEIFCYSGVLRADIATEEFRRIAHHWRPTNGVNDDALAATIRADGIDILVDLAQHTSGNRLPVFARKPAPVQVSFAGYPETTGLPTIDFRITGRWLEAPGQDSPRRIQDQSSPLSPPLTQNHPPSGIPHPESICYLLDSFWCYAPGATVPPVSELPAHANARVTFGSLTSSWKNNNDVLRLWSRILGRVADSRLVLLGGLGSRQQGIVDLFAHEGIAPERIEFVDRCPHDEYLRLYHRLDIALDPFPYGGHTTSLDALWMGVPFITLPGNTAVSRGGMTILRNLDLPEYIAATPTHYVDLAAALAQDLPRLAELRHSLRPRLEKSVLMDSSHFTRQIEQAFRAMWQRWCAHRT
jgi:predicted O-linked N-acetylglucosamine transferase (SPINDLY family)